MIGPKSESFSFDADSIFMNAPNESGVYALLKDQEWVYVGETKDIQSRLFEHLRTDEKCIVRYAPNSFQFEPCSADKRVERQDELILALKPPCSQKLG